MPRLPAPKLVEVRVEPSEDVEERRKIFFSLVATAMRRGELKGKGNDDKDKE